MELGTPDFSFDPACKMVWEMSPGVIFPRYVGEGHPRVAARLGGGTFGEVCRFIDTQSSGSSAATLAAAASATDALTSVLAALTAAAADPKPPLVAIKNQIPFKPNFKVEGPRKTYRELVLLRHLSSPELSHPNVVQLRRAMTKDGSSADVYMVFELLKGGDLAWLRTKATTQHLTLERARAYAWQLCLALHYIHSANICHRDLAPKNVFFEEDRLALADFGLARIMGAEGAPVAGAAGTGAGGGGGGCSGGGAAAAPPPPAVKLTRAVVTGGYRAPELHLFNSPGTWWLYKERVYVGQATNGQYSGAKVDMWSAGMVIGEMFSMMKGNERLKLLGRQGVEYRECLSTYNAQRSKRSLHMHNPPHPTLPTHTLVYIKPPRRCN